MSSQCLVDGHWICRKDINMNSLNSSDRSASSSVTCCFPKLLLGHHLCGVSWWTGATGIFLILLTLVWRKSVLLYSQNSIPSHLGILFSLLYMVHMGTSISFFWSSLIGPEVGRHLNNIRPILEPYPLAIRHLWPSLGFFFNLAPEIVFLKKYLLWWKSWNMWSVDMACGRIFYIVENVDLERK